MFYIRDDTGEVAILGRGKSRSRPRFSENRLAACLGFSWLRNEAAAGRVKDLGHTECRSSRFFDLRAYVSELVKRIRLSDESHSRPLRFRFSRERVRFVESSNGLMVYTSWDGTLSSKPVKALGDDRDSLRSSKRSRRSFSPLPIHDLVKSYPPQLRRLIFLAPLRRAPGADGRKSAASILFQINSIDPRVHTASIRSVKYVLKSSNNCFFFYQTFLKVPRIHFRLDRL